MPMLGLYANKPKRKKGRKQAREVTGGKWIPEVESDDGRI